MRVSDKTPGLTAEPDASRGRTLFSQGAWTRLQELSFWEGGTSLINTKTNLYNHAKLLVLQESSQKSLAFQPFLKFPDFLHNMNGKYFLFPLSLG